MHMPPDNALARAFGDGWSEGEWLLHDMGDMLRDLQLTVVNVSPFIKRQYADADIRPRIHTPHDRMREARSRIGAHDAERHRRERDELMAAITGRA